MINIFEVFLPQLLRYPNPNDPLNGEAAALLMRHPREYDAKVKGMLCCIPLPNGIISVKLTGVTTPHMALLHTACRLRATVRNKGGSGLGGERWHEGGRR